MFLIPILTFLLIIWIIFQILNTTHYNSPNHYNNFNNTGYSLDHSLEILRERYAKGEISDEEYLKIKRNLES